MSIYKCEDCMKQSEGFAPCTAQGECPFEQMFDDRLSDKLKNAKTDGDLTKALTEEGFEVIETGYEGMNINDILDNSDQ